MGALLYLYKTSFKNRMMKALHKPITYFYIIGAIVYGGIIIVAFTSSFGMWEIDSPEGLAAILTVFAFMLIPANLISYIRRKGLLFHKSDSHFVFPAPLNPKLVLLYAQVKQYLIAIFMGAALVVGGTVIFKIEVGRMLLYFLFCCVIQNVAEASLMVLTYGNERFSERVMNGIRYAMYGVIGIFLIFLFVTLKNADFTFQGVMDYLQTPLIQWFPIIGWNISVIYLLIVGPTAVNIVGSILYFAVTAVLLFLAVRMRCTGAYYEDAMKFAEDYAEARKKGRKGEMARLGKKQKYGRATIVYKGAYAKAIFYRQLLEYKKSKTFIFGLMTLLCLVVGMGFVYVARERDFGSMRYFVLPLLMAYLILVLSAYAGKWGKEIRSPYTFLLPDTAFRKLWYATLIEHFRNLLDASILTIPIAITLKLPLLHALLCILLYVCMQACKMYLDVMAEGMLGNVLGDMGKQLLRMLCFGFIVGIAALAAFIVFILLGAEGAFLVMFLILLAETLGCMLLASITFEKMETVG